MNKKRQSQKAQPKTIQSGMHPNVNEQIDFIRQLKKEITNVDSRGTVIMMEDLVFLDSIEQNLYAIRTLNAATERMIDSIKSNQDSVNKNISEDII